MLIACCRVTSTDFGIGGPVPPPRGHNGPMGGGLPKHPRLLLMRLTYSVLCDSMQEVGSASNVSCIGSYQQPHYYYYILRRLTATVKELLLQATKYKYSKLFGIPFKEKY